MPHNRQFSIAIDIDGVLGNFTKPYCQTINKLWPGTIPVNYTPPDWNYSDKLTKEQSDFAFFAVIQNPNLWMDEEPLSGANELRLKLPQLHDADVGIYYVTQRPQTPGLNVLTQTNIWLNTFGLLNSGTSTIVVSAPESKASVLSSIGAKWAIDDKPDTIQQYMLEPSIAHPYLLDQSWNRGEKWRLLPRVLSVTEFLNKVLVEAGSGTGV